MWGFIIGILILMACGGLVMFIEATNSKQKIEKLQGKMDRLEEALRH